jgi:DNA-binding HxlR family transcriptional regulator
VRGYGQYCAMSRGSEVFATRWTPLIVRNLLLGCRTFGEIRAGVPGISRTLLADRLRMLERYGVLERRPNPSGRGLVYEPTEAGEELRPVCNALGAWGGRWLELAPEHFDAGTVLFTLCHVLPADLVPERRTVIRFEIRDRRHERLWLLLDGERSEVCATPPGSDDLVVTTSSEWLTKWHVGRISLGEAMRHGLIELQGPRYLERWFGRVGGLGAGTSLPAPQNVPAPG